MGIRLMECLTLTVCMRQQVNEMSCELAEVWPLFSSQSTKRDNNGHDLERPRPRFSAGGRLGGDDLMK